MALPSGISNEFDWIHSVFSKLMLISGDLNAFQKYWANLTLQQKTQIKDLVVTEIDTAISDLSDIKTHISSL